MREQVEAVIREAGEILLHAALQKNDISEKEGEANFVTVFDKKIQSFLIERLVEIVPDCGFYGEEETEGNNHSLSGWTFYIDPIDGTTNFLFDYKHSCISVGLAFDGVMQAGWIYKPYTAEMWFAKRGEGAFLNQKSLHIEDKGIETGIVAYGCAKHKDISLDVLFDVAKVCYEESLAIRNGGSAALDIARVASGSNQAYFEFRLFPYDYAAASVILEEAGGLICQMNGKAVTLDGPCSVVAGTKKAVEDIRRIIRMRDASWTE